MTDAPTERVEAEFFARLRQRKVVQWSLAYAAGAWGLLQGIGFAADAFSWSPAIKQVALLLLLVGLPVVVVLAWFHGDRGQRRVGRAEFAILTLLFLMGGGLFWRYQRAVDTWTVPAPPPSLAMPANDHSIAVLPFVNMSADKEQEYFADGVSEELLNLLAHVPGLRVIARTTSFSFKGKDVDIAEIAHRLNVANVLEGSVRRSGDTVRITAQLIRASDSSELWSQTYDRQMSDVFKVQDEIAAAVVSELKVKLLGATPKTKVTDSKAYAMFLQAREIGRQYTEKGFEQSNDLYRQALALDPAYAPAWDGMATNYRNQSFYNLVPVAQGVQLAREATNKALALDPGSTTSLINMSWIASSYDLDFAAAARDLEDALALQPANPDVLAEAGYLARRLGRFDQAIEIGEHQIDLDPVSPYGHEIMAYTYRVAGRLDDALAALHTVVSLSPNYMKVHESIGELLLQKGDATAALAEFQQEVSEPYRLVGLSMAHHALGRKAESDAELVEVIKKYGPVVSLNIAYAFAFRGEPDRAFEWLDKAAHYHDLYLSAVGIYPMFASLHSDPRWLPFLRKYGMAPEQLATIKFDVTVPQ